MVKALIKKGLAKFGYEIRALNILNAKNAVEYNTLPFIDKFYADSFLLNKYITENVPVHVRNMEELLGSHKINITSNSSILDVSCGTGHCLKMLNDKYNCNNLTGTELSKIALEIASKICPSAKFAQLDIRDDSLPQQFDLILFQQVLEHLERPEEALDNLVKMLHKDGVLIITIPDGRLDDFAGHIHFWSKDSFKFFLERTLVGYNSTIGSLQDGISLYAIIMNKQGNA